MGGCGGRGNSGAADVGYVNGNYVVGDNMVGGKVFGMSSTPSNGWRGNESGFDSICDFRSFENSTNYDAETNYDMFEKDAETDLYNEANLNLAISDDFSRDEIDHRDETFERNGKRQNHFCDVDSFPTEETQNDDQRIGGWEGERSEELHRQKYKHVCRIKSWNYSDVQVHSLVEPKLNSNLF